MKRIAAMFMMLLMIMNICACKRMPEDTEGVSLPASSDTDSLGENDEISDSTKSFDETKTKTDKSNNHDIYNDISNPSDRKSINKNTSNKAAPCNLTIDNTFSKYAVVATLTNEESVKNKKYTPDDFPGISVFHIFERSDYYSLKYYPEYEGKTTLFMLLDNPSKQTVIDYIKILENDPRVYSAYVDVSKIYESLIYVKYADIKQLNKYTADDFSDLSIKKIDINLTSAQFVLENNGTDSVFNTLKKALKDSRISDARPIYKQDIEDSRIEIIMTYEQAIRKSIYTADDFPTLDISEIIFKDLERANTDTEDAENNKYLMYVYLTKPSEQNLNLAVDAIKSMGMFDSVLIRNPNNVIYTEG